MPASPTREFSSNDLGGLTEFDRQPRFTKITPTRDACRGETARRARFPAWAATAEAVRLETGFPPLLLRCSSGGGAGEPAGASQRDHRAEIPSYRVEEAKK